MARILLVDDDYILRFAIRSILASAGHEVVAAENGEEALQHAKGTKFDLVLTDIQMPNMNGFEFMKELFLDNPEQKIIAMSGTNSVDLSEAASSGAIDVIRKPFQVDPFLERVALVLGVG